MKNTLKIFLALSILCTTVFAGDQGNGGYVCDPDQPELCCDPNDPEQQCGDGFAAEIPDWAETMTMVIFEEALDAMAGYGR